MNSFDPDRERGMLSKRDRRFLLGQMDVESASQREREIRAKIRARVWNTLLDFALLESTMEERDMNQVFELPTAPTDEAQARAAFRDLSFRAMMTILYRYADDGHSRRGFEDFVVAAVEAVEKERRSGGGDDTDVIQLSGADVEIDITPPDMISMSEVMDKLRLVAEGDEFDWTIFNFDELLYLYWTFIDPDDIDNFQKAILQSITNRLEEDWIFTDGLTNELRRMESIPLDLTIEDDIDNGDSSGS